MTTVTLSSISLVKAITVGLHAQNESRITKLALEHMEITRRKDWLESELKFLLTERGRLNQILDA